MTNQHSDKVVGMEPSVPSRSHPPITCIRAHSRLLCSCQQIRVAIVNRAPSEHSSQLIERIPPHVLCYSISTNFESSFEAWFVRPEKNAKIPLSLIGNERWTRSADLCFTYGLKQIMTFWWLFICPWGYFHSILPTSALFDLLLDF